MRMRITRKNKKRKDPRYFLYEGLELDQGPEEEPEAPSEETEDEDTRHPYEKQMDDADQEGAAQRMLAGVEELQPGDWEAIMRLVVNRAKEWNERKMGRDIDLEGLLLTAQGRRGEDEPFSPSWSQDFDQ